MHVDQDLTCDDLPTREDTVLTELDTSVLFTFSSINVDLFRHCLYSNTAMADISEHHVTSLDGTEIGYLQQGSGPGILLIQGAGGTVSNYSELATALSTDSTVYTVERRGRGRSPKAYTPDHTIERDVEDIQAVMTATGSTRIFGLSSGAIITLEVARRIPEITHAIAYEPPFYEPGKSMDGVAQLNKDIEAQDYASAALTIMDTSEMKPLLFQYLPTFVSRALLGTVMRVNNYLGTSGTTFQDLVAASRYDFNVVSAMQDKVDELASMRCSVMVLHGDKSQAFFAPAAKRVEGTVEGCKRVVLEGMNHAGPWNRRYGGRPERVAEVVREFIK